MNKIIYILFFFFSSMIMGADASDKQSFGIQIVPRTRNFFGLQAYLVSPPLFAAFRNERLYTPSAGYGIRGTNRWIGLDLSGSNEAGWIKILGPQFQLWKQDQLSVSTNCSAGFMVFDRELGIAYSLAFEASLFGLCAIGVEWNFFAIDSRGFRPLLFIKFLL